MIKALFDIHKFTPSELLQAQREADRIEDEDFIQVPYAKETCPISTDVNELRAYVRDLKITRKITSVTVHTTACGQDASVTAILNYWKRKGWKNVGYHVLLPKEGFTVLADFNQVTNGALGYNSNGVHVSYIGGIDKNGKALDNRTESQKQLIKVFIQELVHRFPSIKVIGHNEVANKACPCFKVKDEYPQYWTGK
jgi:N-acetylmuramoyl-L-alanine amidase